MDRVYVHLMSGSDAICYWRGKVSDFTSPDAKNMWLPLKCDHAIGECTDKAKSGMI